MNPPIEPTLEQDGTYTPGQLVAWYWQDGTPSLVHLMKGGYNHQTGKLGKTQPGTRADHGQGELPSRLAKCGCMAVPLGEIPSGLSFLYGEDIPKRWKPCKECLGEKPRQYIRERAAERSARLAAEVSKGVPA